MMRGVTQNCALRKVGEVALYLLLFVVVAMVVDLYRGRDIPKTALPEIQSMSIKGEKIDLLELSRNQTLVVYFWGTWCGVCSVSSPSVDSLGNHFNVVSIAMASGSDEVINNYLQKNDYSFTTVNDDDQSIARAFGVHVTPTILFIKNGKLESYTTGASFLPGLYWRAFWS